MVVSSSMYGKKKDIPMISKFFPPNFRVVTCVNFETPCTYVVMCSRIFVLEENDKDGRQISQVDKNIMHTSTKSVLFTH